MDLLTINDIIFILALLLSFTTALLITYLLLNEANNFLFLLLIGGSSLTFSLHHLLELSLKIETSNLNMILETLSVIFFIAAMFQLRRTNEQEILSELSTSSD